VTLPDDLVLPTLSCQALGGSWCSCARRGGIADADWERYVEWLKVLRRHMKHLAVLTGPGGRAPTSTQRAVLNRELNAEWIRLAVLLSDPKLIPIVKVSAWFMTGAKPFRAHELGKALAYLGEGDPAQVRLAIRELGGVVHRRRPERLAERFPRPAYRLARHRAFHERHGPARLHQGGPRAGVDVSQEEPAVAEALGEVGELVGRDSASDVGGGAEALDDVGAVGIGLEAADAPEARVC
jgi:hypothetical protein